MRIQLKYDNESCKKSGPTIMGPDAFMVRCLIFELLEKKNVFDECNVALEWSSTPVAHIC